MILFREEYKGAFNELKADRTQIDKIFGLAEKDTAKKKTKIVPFRYVGTLAAAIAIVIVAVMYPNFSGFLGTEQKEFEPLGVVKYSSDTAWDNTVITGGTQSDEQDIIAASNKESESNIKKEDTARQLAPAEENANAAEPKTEFSQSTTGTVEEGASAENIPMLASQPFEDSVPAADENSDDRVMAVYSKKASSGGGSSAASVLSSEKTFDFGDDKTATVSVYTVNNEIKAAIDERGTDKCKYKLLLVTDTNEKKVVYAEKGGMLYVITAEGMTADELEQLLNDKL